MSKITVDSFLKLHTKQLNNIEYKKGYEYAKRWLVDSFKSMEMAELFGLLQSFRNIGFKKHNYYAIGQSQVILEIIRERLDGGVMIASN